MKQIKQSTSITERIGPFVDNTDGDTPMTSLTIAQADIRLSKNGGDFAQSNDAGGATHDEKGWYYITLDATDTNTLGRLTVMIHATGALPVWRDYMVLTAASYQESVESGGSGANSVTITVDDGTDPLENATVTMKLSGVEVNTLQTNSSGQAVFSLANGTWQVRIYKGGYEFTPTTLAVSGTTAQTYSMTQVTYTPSDVGRTTGYLYCYDEDGAAESSVSVSVEMIGPSRTRGYAYDGALRTESSNASGLVEFVGMWKGCTYRVRRGSDEWFTTKIPEMCGAAYDLESIIGED